MSRDLASPSFGRRLMRTAEARWGLALLLPIVLLALAAPWLSPGDPQAIVGPSLLVPFADATHWLGTDRLGRSVLAGLLHGASASLIVAAAAAAGALGLGTVIGTAAGFAGGRTDEALMRVTEAFQAVPGFILALALVSVLQASLGSVVLAIAVSSWTGPARVVRAEILSLRQRDFVDAYRVLGMPRWQIAFREVLPNALPPVITLAAVVVAGAILVEAALSFLGLGDPNRITWGRMIAEGRGVLRTAPYLSLIPGLAIVLTVLAVNLIGDAVNEALAGRRVVA
jgi:peptide/nickel transport system permease protein